MAGLPLELTSFIGREPELVEIKRLLASAPLITLTGLGGVGKSRLGLHSAHALGRKFPDGVRSAPA
jgi:non-specific serine/threonine protein kinase